MIRRFSKLLNQRSFTTTKNTDRLKEEFQKLTEQHNANTQNVAEKIEEIKLTDHAKATDDLKNKFEGIKHNLEKNTGEAKGLYVRFLEAAKNFKTPNISFSDFKEKFAKKEKKMTKEEIKNKFAARQVHEKINEDEDEENEETIHIAEEKPEANSKESEPIKKKERFLYLKSIISKYPKAENAILKSNEKLKVLWRETFPKPDEKIQRLKKIHEMRKLSKEIDEKIARGEINPEDIPEWKRNALAVIPKKLTVWDKVKNKFTGTKISSTIQDKTADILASDSVKQVKTKIKEIKEGIEEVKDVVKDSLDESESKVYQSAKDMVNTSLLETAEAKAVKVMRESDPDFDIHAMETEMPKIAKVIFEKFLEADEEYLKNVLSGSAHHWFNEKMDLWKKDNVKPKYPEIISISKASYLGVNAEDKGSPRFSYGFNLIYSSELISKETGNNIDEEENKAGTNGKTTIGKKLQRTELNFKENPEENPEENSREDDDKIDYIINTNYLVTFIPHPDPDISTYEHPWLFLAFIPADGANRLNS